MNGGISRFILTLKTQKKKGKVDKMGVEVKRNTIPVRKFEKDKNVRNSEPFKWIYLLPCLSVLTPKLKRKRGNRTKGVWRERDTTLSHYRNLKKGQKRFEIVNRLN